MLELRCIICDKAFYGKRNRKHCSIACRSVTNTLPRERTSCENCGKVFSFLPKAERPRFCSRECYERGRDIPVAIRFWPKVSIGDADECWLWIAGFTKHGYGKFGLPGNRIRNAHRVSYELEYGPVPKGQQINHKCDVRACVNPRHLYAGTAKQNTRDAIYRNRLATGERHGRVKLTLKQVQEIRQRFRNGEKNAMRLAKEYEVGDTQIRRIVRGQKWRNAPIP